MKRIITFLALVAMCGEQAGATNLYERYIYSQCGRNYYGYRPYAAPAVKPYEHHAENYSRQFHLEYHYYQPPAAQGNTVYGLSSFDATAYAGRLVNTSGILAEKFIEASAKTSADASAFDLQAANTQSVVLREVVANQKLQLLAQATEVRAPSTIVYGQAESKPRAPAGGTLGATEQACQVCHAANVSDAKGNGNTLPSLAEFTAQQADIALEYVTRTDANNCSKKANLNPEAQRELVKFLCKKANQ